MQCYFIFNRDIWYYHDGNQLTEMDVMSILLKNGIKGEGCDNVDDELEFEFNRTLIIILLSASTMVGANTLPDSITSKLYFKFLTLHFHLECGNWKDRQSYTHYLGGMWSLSCKWGFRNRDKRNVSHQPLGSHLNLIIYVSDGGILPLIIFTPLACVSDGSMAIARSVGQDQPSAGRTRWQINHFHHWKEKFKNIKLQKWMA